MVNILKFKLGDEVRCIKGKTEHEGLIPGGQGWKLDKTFIVGSITNQSEKNKAIYWPEDDNGVYEDWLELVEEDPVTKLYNKLIKEVIIHGERTRVRTDTPVNKSR